MLRSMFKGLFQRPWMALLWFLLVAVLFLIACFATVSHLMAGSAQMELGEVLEIATFAPGESTSRGRHDLLQENAELFQQIATMDRRTFAAGYSETIDPAWVSYSYPSAYQPAWSPQDVTVFIATCVDIQQTQRRASASYYNFIHTYTFQIEEFLYLDEKLTRSETVTLEQVYYGLKDKEYVPLLEVGKHYLTWGHYSVDANGIATIQNPLNHGSVARNRTVDQNGKHILIETVKDSLDFAPLVSELNVSPEGFWQTEMGKIWQDKIMAKLPVCQHSVSVIGTDCLESIYAFNQGLCTVVDGEVFNELHYSAGDRVCMISEELARVNGLSLGDDISLKLYDADYRYESTYTVSYRDSYDSSVGYKEEGQWRIIGIYHTDYTDEQDQLIHPNTVFVPNGSMHADYESNYMPLMSCSYILSGNGWEQFKAQANVGGYAGWFVYGDGGKSEVLEENNRRQTALTEWQAAVETWCKPLPTVSTVLMAVAMLVFVLSKKKEIGRLYAIETTNRTLFMHFFVQTIIVGALAFGLALLLASPILSRVVPTVLRDLADPAYADLLMAGIPEESLSWTPILGKQVLIYTVISAICAAIGAGRRYQFEYHN